MGLPTCSGRPDEAPGAGGLARFYPLADLEARRPPEVSVGRLVPRLLSWAGPSRGQPWTRLCPARLCKDARPIALGRPLTASLTSIASLKTLSSNTVTF